MASSLRVVIAVGGTGGHLYPGIAVARELLARRPNAEVSFAGTAQGIEARVVPREGFALDVIRSSGVKGKSFGGFVRGVARVPLGLLDGFLSQGKPVLGICRGAQLINVAYGGTLLQDIATQRPEAQSHVDAELYDEHRHEIRFEPQSRLAGLYPGLASGLVTSIHHQAVDVLGGDLEVEARAAGDGMVEAIRARGKTFVVGVQWHPEFHFMDPALLSGEPLMNAFLAAATQALDI